MGKHVKKKTNGKERPGSSDRSSASAAPPPSRPASPASSLGGTRNPDPAARYRDEARAKRRRTKTILLTALAVVGVLALAASAWAWQLARSVQNELTGPAVTSEQIQRALAQTPVKKHEPFTVLILGVDHLGQKGDTRSDTIILGRVEPETNKVWLLSIPRDTRAEIPGHGVQKINQAYTLGGPALAIKTVTMLTGVRPDHYVEVDIAGFKHIVEVLGGVWINVDQRINDSKAAGANVGKVGALIEPGYQKLDPNHAIVYVRSRAFADADFTRMRHQQEFLKAVAKQASKPVMIPRLSRLLRVIARYVKTDIRLGEMVSIVRDMKGTNPDTFQTATVPGEWRTPYVWPDEQKMAELVTKMTSGREFKAPTNAKDIVPADYTVVVRNGSGIEGLAATAAGLLRPSGFKIGEVSNAKRQDYSSTVIVYSPENVAVAKRVQSTLRRGKLLEDTSGKYTFAGDVLVVVGRDWRSQTSSVAPASAKP